MAPCWLGNNEQKPNHPTAGAETSTTSTKHELRAKQKDDMKTKDRKAIRTEIVVIDRGWVVVGEVTSAPDKLTITNARCIRRWGTTQGLGQLVEGPLPNTVLDPLGTVVVPIRSVIMRIRCTRTW